MPYDITDAKDDIQTLASQSDFLYKAVQKMNALIVDGGGEDVFEQVKQEIEEEAEPNEDKIAAPTKKKGKKNPLV